MKLEEMPKLKIFLCHASEDKAHVRQIYSRLKEEGFDPWLDVENILPGQDWRFEIAQAVRQTHVVLVCLSHKSTTKAGYVQKEITYALDQADEQPEGVIFVIPIKLEECNVPQRLSKWQWLNYFEENGHNKLINSLTRRCIELGVGPYNSEIETSEVNHSISSDSQMLTVLNTIRNAQRNKKTLNWNDFDWISNHRRELSGLLNPNELAFALKCSLQHGKNLPFWCNINSNNPDAVESIVQPIFENYGRRPLLRAGFAMEKLNSDLKKVAFDKAYSHVSKLEKMGNDIPLRIINAANAGNTIELWKNELSNDLTYGAVINQLIQEISEPEI